MNRNSSPENQDMNNNWMASSFPDESPPAYSDLFPSGFNVGDGNAGWERESENIEESSLTTAREPISVPRTENATQEDTELASPTRQNSFPQDSKKKTLANVLGLLDINGGIVGIIVGMTIKHWHILRLPSIWSILIGIAILILVRAEKTKVIFHSGLLSIGLLAGPSVIFLITIVVNFMAIERKSKKNNETDPYLSMIQG